MDTRIEDFNATQLEFQSSPSLLSPTSIPVHIFSTYGHVQKVKLWYKTWSKLENLFINVYNRTTMHYFVQKHVFEVFDDETCFDEFMHLKMSEKSDIFRYLAMYTYGGIYCDVDMLPKSSPLAWLAKYDAKK